MTTPARSHGDHDPRPEAPATADRRTPIAPTAAGMAPPSAAVPTPDTAADRPAALPGASTAGTGSAPAQAPDPVRAGVPARAPATATGVTAAAAAPAVPESPSIPGTSPRIALYSARYEATAVADHDTLSIHLDRFATNAPVTDAQLTVEAGAARGPAERLPDGSYRFRHAVIDAPGPLALRLQVDEPGQPPDLLAGTLRTGPADDAADDGHGHGHGHDPAGGSHDGRLGPALWAAAALALIGAAVAGIRRLRRARRPHPTRTSAGDDAS